MTGSVVTEADLVTVRGTGPYAGLGGYVAAVDGDQALVRFGGFTDQVIPAADLEVYRPPPPATLRQLRWNEVLEDIDEVLADLSPEERADLARLFRIPVR